MHSLSHILRTDVNHVIQLEHFIAASGAPGLDYSATEFCMDTNYPLKDTEKVYYVPQIQ